MTFREKLKMEYPDRVDSTAKGGCIGCPATYNYEKLGCPYVSNSIPTEEICTKCWDREIPVTEPNKPTEPTEPTEQPKASHTKPSGIATTDLMDITLTVDELVALIDFIECDLIRVIQEDLDIDNLELVANIIMAWKKLKAKQMEVDSHINL